MSDLSQGLSFAFGASVSWALANVAVQRSTRLVGTFRGLLWAQVAGGVMAAALSLACGERPAALTGETLAWLLGAGVSSLLAYLCMFRALEHGRLSIAVPIMSAWAVISTAISVLLFREPVRPLQLGGAALVIGGVGLVSRHAREAVEDERAGRGPRRPRWVLAAMGAALGFGLLIPALGRLTPTFGRLGSVSAVFATDMVLGLPLAALWRLDLRPPPRGARLPVVLAGFFEAAGFVCIALTVGRAPLAVVSPLASLASALTVLYAWVVLRDRPPPLALAGAALACAGVVALAL